MTTTLLKRNREFATNFDLAELAIIPKLRTVIIACGDARVDPAHVLSLELGDALDSYKISEAPLIESGKLLGFLNFKSISDELYSQAENG